MRKAPGPIPEKLPDVAVSARMIQREVIDRPDIRLTDVSIGQLVLDLNDGTPTYLTGSNVWLRSIFNVSPTEKLDYNVILSSQDSAERWIEGVLSIMNSRLPKTHRYTRTSNRFGSGRISMPDGTPIIDAWFLQEGESIAELLMAYPADYQRSAYHVSHSPTPASLVRLARKTLTLDRLAKIDRSDVYPGRARMPNPNPCTEIAIEPGTYFKRIRRPPLTGH